MRPSPKPRPPDERRPSLRVCWPRHSRQLARHQALPHTSAFNGYHRTPSDYSTVRCLKCRGVWRTKAAYVTALKVLQPGEDA